MRGKAGEKPITLGRVVILLLLVFLLSLAAFLYFHGRAEALEAELALFNSPASIVEQPSRYSEIWDELHGRRGVYWYRDRTGWFAGLSGFALFCVCAEGLRRWLAKKM